MENFISIILKYDAWVRLLHIGGVIIALGSVVVADLLLLWLKFKPKMASTMAQISPILSLQVWIGLIVLSVSGLLMFLARQGIEQNPLFQLKMFLVLLVFLNGIFLNVWITPRFEALVPEWHQNTKKVKNFMVIAGIATAISFVSWWGIVIIMTVFY